MQPQTFDQLFKFRKYCLCGNELVTIFNHSIHADDEYTTVKPTGAYQLIDNNSKVIFPCNLDSRAAPYGEVNFIIHANVSSPSIKVIAEFAQPHLTKIIISPNDFVRRHFTEDVQQKFNINLTRKCHARVEAKLRQFSYTQPCGFSYVLSVGPILFDFVKNEMKPISLLEETFTLVDDKEHSYRFRTNFTKETTTITYSVPKPGFVIGGQESIDLPIEKFLKYPLEREFLLNKVKTLLLFS
jgi:hypothetical protein